MAQAPTVGALEIQNAVSLNGAETISGAKTFSGANTFSSTNTFSGVTTFSGAQVFQALKTGEQSENVEDNKTLDEGDIGVVQNVTVDAKTITLPATVVGYSYTIRNGGADGAVAVTVSPNANDKIMGNGYTSEDNKDAVNTKTTAKKGDYIKLVGDGVNGWMITEVVGTWAKQA